MQGLSGRVKIVEGKVNEISIVNKLEMNKGCSSIFLNNELLLLESRKTNTDVE